ncbi:hypothetical protein O7626_30525 [Micromonospora sp. WMMD1102]|uniref:hypothetical protein n=1 Tax=Micromonospora sp. WMMD1102 TaxID=3016105 RepID=UPI0024151FD7|nr:hypothetical protein [Micromonospora sp. WMMD1102]MDG4790208.1 hypothetical protein [Micromonospora sp. WMMD1102]
MPGWETSAWLTEGAFCVRATRTGAEVKDDAANNFVFCNPVSSALDSSGPPMLPAKPLPYVAPLDPQQQEIILVGNVRGDVATVSVTMFGETATAAVHPLPVSEGRQVGAYAVWLPKSGPGRDGMSLSDITAVIGYDAAGDVIAELE